jgi:hypothetical protein
MIEIENSTEARPADDLERFKPVPERGKVGPETADNWRAREPHHRHQGHGFTAQH